MDRLKNKVAFITGGGGGIGRATAERFAEEGAKVIIAEIDIEAGKSAALSAKKIAKNTGGDAYFIETNVSDADSVKTAIKKTIEKYGKLHILHNNAGGSTLQDGPVTEAPIEELISLLKEIDIERNIHYKDLHTIMGIKNINEFKYPGSLSDLLKKV